MPFDPKQLVVSGLLLKDSDQMRGKSISNLEITSFDLSENGSFNMRGVVKTTEAEPYSATSLIYENHQHKLAMAKLLNEVHINECGKVIKKCPCSFRYIHDGLSIVDGVLCGQELTPLSYIKLPAGTHAEVVMGQAWINEVKHPELGYVAFVYNDVDQNPIFIKLELK